MIGAGSRHRASALLLRWHRDSWSKPGQNEVSSGFPELKRPREAAKSALGTVSEYYPGNKEGHIPTRSASEGPMKSSESRRGSPWDD